jgi:hypothetical protein
MKKTPEQLKQIVDQLTAKGIGDGPDCPEVDFAPPTLIKDGVLKVSGEESHSVWWMDYYGEYRGNDPWIHPALEEFAKEQGGIWEWDHPGSISFHI